MALEVRLRMAFFLPFLRLFVGGAEEFVEIVIGNDRQGPFAGCGGPRLSENHGIVDGGLVDNVVLRGSGDALDYVFVFAMKPPSEIRDASVEGDRIDDQRIFVPMRNG